MGISSQQAETAAPSLTLTFMGGQHLGHARLDHLKLRAGGTL